MRPIFITSLLGAVLVFVVGCGQTGALYLPEEDADKPATEQKAKKDTETGQAQPAL